MVPLDGFKSQTTEFRECSSVEERLDDIEKVEGSNPSIPTLKKIVLDSNCKRGRLFPNREKFKITSTFLKMSGGEVPLEHQ